MIDKNKLIIPTSWTPDRDEFLEALKITPDGLGSQLFNTVFDALFVDSIDLREEFRKYYSVEYPTLSEYIEIRYGEVLEGNKLEAERLFLVTWLPQIIDTNYDDNMLSTVLEHISLLEEAQNENQT